MHNKDKACLNNDTLDASYICSLITRLGTVPGAVSVLKSIDSTNNEARRRIPRDKPIRGPDGLLTKLGLQLHRSVITADTQSAGRGRLGRPFYSPPRTGVYLSLIYSPLHGIKDPALMTVVAAVAVCRAVEKLFGVECKIKWVNDIIANDKKICGILTEGIIDQATCLVQTAIIGIGINIQNGGFSEELSKTAGSILSSSHSMVSRNALIAQVVYEALSIYDLIGKENDPIWLQCIQEYRQRSIVIGRTVSVNSVAGLDGEQYYAHVLDIDDQAQLIVELDGGERKALHSGEVTLKSINFTK